MDLQNMDIFKYDLIQKLSLLLFLNSNDISDLDNSKKIILSCEYKTKREIIELIETEEYNYGFKKQ